MAFFGWRCWSDGKAVGFEEFGSMGCDALWCWIGDVYGLLIDFLQDSVEVFTGLCTCVRYSAVGI